MSRSDSEVLFERSKKVVPGGVHSPVRAFRGVGGVPRFIQSASGSYIRDVEGRSYLDFCMSWGPLIFGHQDPETREAVQSALHLGWSYGTAEPYSLELAEFITSAVPWVQQIRFVNSGTEAVMAALRLARAATGRSKILKFEGCYHGHVDSMLVKAGSGLAEMASPDSAGVTAAEAAHTLVAPLNQMAALEEIFQTHGSEIAAVIIEPIPANNGLLIPQEGFLQKVAQLARSSGSLLIFDEVITGFRMGFGGVAEQTGIQPDLVTYGKIIGGGFPVGAYGGRGDLMNWVAPSGPVYQAGTLSANPVAMVAGLTTLKKLKRENPYELLEQKTRTLAHSLEAIGREYDFPVHIQKWGSLFWLVLGSIQTPDGVVRAVGEIPNTSKEKFAVLLHSLLQQGVYLAPSAFEVSFLSTAHSAEDLGFFEKAFRQSIQAIQEGRL